MSVILTSWVVQGLLFILAIVCVIVGVWLLTTDLKISAVVPGVLLVLFLWGFFWGVGHAVVEPNTVMLVIDRQTGQQVGPLRTAGITDVPWLTSVSYVYPAQTIYQWCPKFTPSSKGGAGLITDVCFTADASGIDWVKQFHAFNGNIDVVTAGWQNAIQANVAIAISKYVPRELTDKRADVENDIFNNTKGWFKDNGIPVSMVGLKNWKFEDPNAQTEYDRALLSQTKIDIANADQQAALIRAETQRLIADKQRQACITAGMTSEYACLQYLWLTSGIIPSNVILTVGGSNPDIAIVPSSVTPTVTPAPTDTKK